MTASPLLSNVRHRAMITPVSRVDRWPVFHRPGRYFTVDLAETVRSQYFENLCLKPALWK